MPSRLRLLTDDVQLINLVVGLIAPRMFASVKECFEYVIDVAGSAVRWEQRDMH